MPTRIPQPTTIPSPTPSVATGRTYDTIYLATSNRPSRMLVAATAGDAIDRTKIGLIWQPGVEETVSYQHHLERGPDPAGLDHRQYVDVQIPMARRASRLMVSPVGMPDISSEDADAIRRIYSQGAPADQQVGHLLPGGAVRSGSGEGVQQDPVAASQDA